MKSAKHILFTGGGTAGHVTPNVALITNLQRLGWKIDYIGSADGIEKQIIAEVGVPFHPISSGKLRRYFDLKNIRDPLRVIKGIYQAYRIIKKIKPTIVFSKGGFVSVPVVIGSWMNKIPVVIHESDMTPGLANKLSIPFASRVCVTFPETLKHITGHKAVHTGLPIREEILRGNRQEGLRLCQFRQGKPIVLVMGGSQGSKAINESLREQLSKVTDHFQVAHICGKGNVDTKLEGVKGYKQFEYVSNELPHLLAMTDIVVSRAGATSLSEFLALKKPMVLIPLSLKASRGDQLENAKSFEGSGFAKVLQEENLTSRTLLSMVLQVYGERHLYVDAMNGQAIQDGMRNVLDMIEELAV